MDHGVRLLGKPHFTVAIKYSSGLWGNEGVENLTRFVCYILGTSVSSRDPLEYLFL